MRGQRGLTKQVYNENAASILRYLRISHGLTQDEMAQILGCSKYRLSRLEAAKLSLLSFEATNAARYFKMSLEDIARGHITEIHQRNDFEMFQVPQRLKDNAHSGGRALFLHGSNFKDYFGTGKFKELCAEEGVDPSYLVNISNPLNLAFNSRLLQEMIKAGHLNTKAAIEDYVRKHLNSPHHSGFIEEYEACRGLERLIALINHAEAYEQNHKFELLWHDKTRETIDIKISIKEHVDKKMYFDAPWVGGFLIKEFLPAYFSIFINAPNEYEILSANDDGKHSCVIRYKLCEASLPACAEI